MKIAIVGNSAASTAAIEAIRKYDTESKITQFSDESAPLYSRCLISYYLAGTIDKRGLSYRGLDFHKNMNVDLKLGNRVVEVLPKRQQIRCENGTVVDYDKVLIATGGSAKIPQNIPKETQGVFVLRTLNDAEAIKKRIPSSKNAVILGGGLIGMRAAYALSQCGIKVTVVIRSNRVLSQMIDYPAAQIIKNRLSENNIDIMTQTDVTEIISKGKKLVAVKTDHDQTINCEILIAAKGVNANTELVRDTDVEVNWGIKTNPYMQTNVDNIYAAGDVAETFDITTEEYTINALWTCAVQQGQIAGMNIINRQRLYDGSLGMNSLNFFDIPLISFGITTPKDDSKYRILVDRRPEKNIYKKIVIGNNRIKGIILVGKIDNAGVLLSLIPKKMVVSPFEDELLGDHFNFGSVLKYGGKSEFDTYHHARIGS